MIKLKVPYARDALEFAIPEANFAGEFKSGIHDYCPEAGETELVNRAFDAPIDSPRLEELASKVDNAVIIASDHTRPVPSKMIIPPMLERLRAGNPAIDITILIATGFHRATTREELIDKFGLEIVEKEKIVVHDSRDSAAMVNLGTLPSGGELLINRLAAEAGLLLSEGFIEPHFFAGFSGGRKSVLPGIASAQTVLANHCSEFIRSEYARTGNLENRCIATWYSRRGRPNWHSS
jgi:nickel-dependent lactate racemase